MYYAELAAAIEEFIKERDQNLALADIAHAVHAAVGAKVFERIRPYRKIFSDADIEKLLDTRRGQWLTAREAFAAVGYANVSHGDAVSGGMQLKHVFDVRKVGTAALYLIERRETIA